MKINRKAVETAEKIVTDYFIYNCTPKTYKIYTEKIGKFRSEIYNELVTRREILKCIDAKKYEKAIELISSHPMLSQKIEPEKSSYNKKSYQCCFSSNKLIFLLMLSLESMVFIENIKQKNIVKCISIAKKYTSEVCAAFCSENKISHDLIDVFSIVGYRNNANILTNYDSEEKLNSIKLFINSVVYEIGYNRKKTLFDALLSHCESIIYFIKK